MRRIVRAAAIVGMSAAIATGMAGCGGSDETTTVTEEAVETTETTPETGVPEDGPVDALAVLGALGSAQDDVENAFVENGVLILTLRGDPADIETGEIADACERVREATGALGVEVETPDRTRTKVC